MYAVRPEERAYIVLEEDGTEVDEEEYFALLPDRTHLMLLSAEQLWSPNYSLQGWVGPQGHQPLNISTP